jgi:hypothetical protein
LQEWFRSAYCAHWWWPSASRWRPGSSGKSEERQRLERVSKNPSCNSRPPAKPTHEGSNGGSASCIRARLQSCGKARKIERVLTPEEMRPSFLKHALVVHRRCRTAGDETSACQCAANSLTCHVREADANLRSVLPQSSSHLPANHSIQVHSAPCFLLVSDCGYPLFTAHCKLSL